MLSCVIQKGLTQSQKAVVPESTVIKTFEKINGRLGPSFIYLDTLIEKGAFLIVNNVLIKNKNQIILFFKDYKNKYKALKYYSKEKAHVKWNILNDEGVFSCRVKKIIIILN